MSTTRIANTVYQDDKVLIKTNSRIAKVVRQDDTGLYGLVTVEARDAEGLEDVESGVIRMFRREDFTLLDKDGKPADFKVVTLAEAVGKQVNRLPTRPVE